MSVREHTAQPRRSRPESTSADGGAPLSPAEEQQALLAGELQIGNGATALPGGLSLDGTARLSVFVSPGSVRRDALQELIELVWSDEDGAFRYHYLTDVLGDCELGVYPERRFTETQARFFERGLGRVGANVVDQHLGEDLAARFDETRRWMVEEVEKATRKSGREAAEDVFEQMLDRVIPTQLKLVSGVYLWVAPLGGRADQAFRLYDYKLAYGRYDAKEAHAAVSAEFWRLLRALERAAPKRPSRSPDEVNSAETIATLSELLGAPAEGIATIAATGLVTFKARKLKQPRDAGKGRRARNKRSAEVDPASLGPKRSAAARRAPQRRGGRRTWLVGAAIGGAAAVLAAVFMGPALLAPSAPTLSELEADLAEQRLSGSDVVTLNEASTAPAPALERDQAEAEARWSDAVRETVTRAQIALTSLGYDVGKIDGKWGEKSELALRSFQKQVGLPESGVLDGASINALQEARRSLAAAPDATAPDVAAAEQARRPAAPQRAEPAERAESIGTAAISVPRAASPAAEAPSRPAETPREPVETAAASAQEAPPSREAPARETPATETPPAQETPARAVERPSAPEPQASAPASEQASRQSSEQAAEGAGATPEPSASSAAPPAAPAQASETPREQAAPAPSATASAAPAPARPAETPAQPVASSLKLAQAEPEVLRQIQTELARLTLYQSGVDGRWGPGTERAVQAFLSLVGEPKADPTPERMLALLLGAPTPVQSVPAGPFDDSAEPPADAAQPAQSAPAPAPASEPEGDGGLLEWFLRGGG